jgi:sugar-specific transcriptional regulator TrmB
MIQKELATTLERIGFTPGESKVYLALLGLGSTSSGKIILESGVSRSKVYEILDRLTEKGLVTQVIRENTKYFQAASPERISDYIGRKEVEIEREKHEFQSALPALRQMAAEHDEEQSAKVYVGFEGIKTFYDDILREAKKDDEYLALTFSDESMNNNSINNLFEYSTEKEHNKA